MSNFEVAIGKCGGGGGGGVGILGTGVTGGDPADVKSVTGLSMRLNLYLGLGCQKPPELVDRGRGKVPAGGG